MPSNLMLVGASIRAAAFSARRANLHPWGADLFLDADLSSAGAAFQRVTNSKSFLNVSTDGPSGPWMYTGALENRPGLVEQISRRRFLWGNAAKILRQVRNPCAVFTVLKEADVPCPEISPAGQEKSARWLQKPRAGAGGKGITIWTGNSVARGHYVQQFVEGEPCAAIFVAGSGRAALLGVTQQLVGQPWLHAGPFQYCGSVGSLILNRELRQAFLRLGNALAAGFLLQGLFGVDCIIRDNVPWPVEVNPRYTASVEVLELSTGKSALLEHARVFDPSFAAGVSRPEHAHETRKAGIVGKAILFARGPLTIPQESPWCSANFSNEGIWTVPAFADIPESGQSIAAHQPIVSFFARDDTVAGCMSRLQQIVADLDRQLFPS